VIGLRRTLKTEEREKLCTGQKKSMIKGERYEPSASDNKKRIDQETSLVDQRVAMERRFVDVAKSALGTAGQ